MSLTGSSLCTGWCAIEEAGAGAAAAAAARRAEPLGQRRDRLLGRERPLPPRHRRVQRRVGRAASFFDWSSE